jgi:hypothetical protein
MNKNLILIIIGCVGLGVLEIFVITGNLPIPRF